MKCTPTDLELDGAFLEDVMCRSIKKLRFDDREVTAVEVEEAALQYVRKVSGFRKPSQKNEAVFDEAVQEIAEATQKLLDALIVRKSTRN